MHKPESVLENEMLKLLWDFGDTNESANLGQTTRPYNKKKQTRRIVDFAVSALDKLKLKESEKKDLALGTVTKGLVQGLEKLKIRGQVEII